MEEKDTPKGSEAALWNLAFIRGFGGETYVLFYVFALVHFTRFRLVRRRAGGVRFARLRRKVKHRLFAAISLPQALLPPDSCLLLRLRQNRWHSKNNQRFANFAVRWLRECSDLSWQRSTQRQGNKRQRRSRLNRVNCTIARRYAQSTSGFLSRMNPGGIKGGRNPLCTPFLLLLSSCNERWSPRRAFR